MWKGGVTAATAVAAGEVEAMTGPLTTRAPVPPPPRGQWQLQEMRRNLGDERTLYTLSEWSGTELSRFRK